MLHAASSSCSWMGDGRYECIYIKYRSASVAHSKSNGMSNLVFSINMRWMI